MNDERKSIPSGDVGIFLSDKPVVCCFCDETIPKNSLVKRVGSRYATIACADKALIWVADKRDEKRRRANEEAGN